MTAVQQHTACEPGGAVHEAVLDPLANMIRSRAPVDSLILQIVYRQFYVLFDNPREFGILPA